MSENWSAQVSIKTPAGTLINLRGENGDRVEQGLAWLTKVAPAIVEAEQAFGGVATVAATFPGSTVVEQAGPSWSQQGSQPLAQGSSFGGGDRGLNAPQQAPAPAPQGGKSCVHGAMVYREGVGAKGAWKAYFCPTPKGTQGQCSPEFLR